MKVLVNGFMKKESSSGIILIFITIFALILRNSPLSDYYYDFLHISVNFSIASLVITKPLYLWINDGLMALFFLMVGLEIKREMTIGELSSVSKASFPIVAAIGGMVIPALVYVAFNPDNPFGFGIPMATDIAFALGILMLLGSRVNPALKLFLVALAVVDDLGAVLVVATVYTSEIKAEYFLHAGVTYALIWLLNYLGIKKILPYLILGIYIYILFYVVKDCNEILRKLNTGIHFSKLLK